MASLDQADLRVGSFDRISRRAFAVLFLMDREDASPAVFDRSRGRGRWNRVIALASDPAMSSAATSLSGTGPGHAPTRLFARCSAPRRDGPRGLGGREVLPSQSEATLLPNLTRRRSWGSTFAGLLPQAGGPTFLPARAHVPFALIGPPRLIFVGVIGRLAVTKED